MCAAREEKATSRVARGRRRNLYGKHRTPKGLRERVSLKSSGNEGFTAVRDGGGVKTPPGHSQGEEAERNTPVFKWNGIARDPA